MINLRIAGTDMSRIQAASILITLVMLSVSCGTDSDIEKPSVILIILDAVRADHLSCYGYSRETSPVLDSLAAHGLLFTRCQAQSPWTLPSCASIVSGLSVKSHGVLNRNRLTYRLDPSMGTLATILSDAGFQTAGIVNNPLLSPAIGFSDGMDYYSFYPEGDGKALETVNEALEWLSSFGSSPFFLMIHIMDPHAPYSPPAPFDMDYSQIGTSGGTEWIRDEEDPEIILNPSDRDHLIDMYDGEIRWTDAQLSRLFSGLREMGLADSLLIIVVADHGDEFLEHGGVDHGHTLYQELLHVPLIISGAGLEPAVITEPVGQFDILPTVLDYLDLENPESIDGISLLSDLSRDRVLPSSGLRGSNLASTLRSNRKVIGDMDTHEYRMYDLLNDPGELESLSVDSSAISDLETYWTTPPLYTPPEVDSQSEVQNSLQDLGYIR
jgi:arylsulfatase A-like enzyme